jgi:hypothetical protein
MGDAGTAEGGSKRRVYITAEIEALKGSPSLEAQAQCGPRFTPPLPPPALPASTTASSPLRS